MAAAGSKQAVITNHHPLMARQIVVFLCIAKTILLCRAFQSRLLPSRQRQLSLGGARSHQAPLRSSKLSNDEIRRYSRHLVLSDVGVKGQEVLKQASVLVIGAGGLGSPALLYLAAAGVGHIGIVDGDTVDESNLQRQIIHSVATVGVSKCDSAKQAIWNINPHVQVRTFREEFTSQTAERIVTGGFYAADDDPDQRRTKSWDVIIDGSDNFPTKYLIK
jgi:sulfur-carrier protein adenylyltransferase/sulfurtransferase